MHISVYRPTKHFRGNGFGVAYGGQVQIRAQGSMQRTSAATSAAAVCCIGTASLLCLASRRTYVEQEQKVEQENIKNQILGDLLDCDRRNHDSRRIVRFFCRSSNWHGATGGSHVEESPERARSSSSHQARRGRLRPQRVQARPTHRTLREASSLHETYEREDRLVQRQRCTHDTCNTIIRANMKGKTSAKYQEMGTMLCRGEQSKCHVLDGGMTVNRRRPIT